MNIKTMNVQSILNQSQVLDLFSDSDYNDEPILYFGYQKNRFGQFVNPQIVYIDDEKINFTITASDIQIHLPVSKENNNKINEISPKLKGDNSLKKAN